MALKSNTATQPEEEDEDIGLLTLDEGESTRTTGGGGTSPITYTGPTATPYQVGATTTQKPIIPKGPQPALEEYPDLIIPEVDESKITSLTQRISSPAIRALSRTTRQALIRHYNNPKVQ